ncbi:NmrA family NAD(P)-binding protein [Streptomyces sp. NPDC088354]|uniref:NmrA family NAD(P)-binding protein n=1 Tax=unclassified Streptomyces TaxID=2593676 RepID=UPI0029B786CE|nr:NmrA family NAD(P)-binding protein [Streptomyces sp. MI02-7b]MDX3075740.1 NmrA family NAD(P)-binding protein [Streptomyces sp. MI02-7b]
MPGKPRILVTGAAGNVGGVGRSAVEVLRDRGFPVRAFVRREDDRAEALRAIGAEVFVGDLTSTADVAEAVRDCTRMYFGMSVSAQYLQAALVATAVARDHGRLDVLVNMSQMTVSQMDLTGGSDSRQHRQQWLVEQTLNWSGVPVTHVRPTVFMENPLLLGAGFGSITRDGTIRLPFGSGRTSPVLGRDVGEAVAAILADPAPHIGRVHELTGAASRDMNAIAAEFSEVLGRPVRYVDVPYEEWVEKDLGALGLPEHVQQHLSVMARLHAENRYDRVTDDLARIIGRPASGVGELVEAHPEVFA